MKLKFIILIFSLILLITVPIYGASLGTYVSENGNDTTGDGTKTNPFKTIQYGIDVAVLLGSNSVYISEGIYPEHVIMSNGVSILGGYSLDFNSRDTNLINYRTKIDGTGDGRCIFIKNVIDETKIEGLIVSNGYLTGSMNDGAGIHCTNCSSDLIIKNNEIKNNTSLDSYGGGIYLWYSSPGIYNNQINSNKAVYGGGLYLSSSSSKIYANIINKNSGMFGAGLYAYNNSPAINDNIISSNIAVRYGGGLFLNNVTSDVSNNIISANISLSGGGGMYVINSTLNIYNNMFFKNGNNNQYVPIIFSGSSELHIKGNNFISNIGYLGYEAIKINGGVIKINDNLMEFNIGSILNARNNSTWEVFNNTINNNTDGSIRIYGTASVAFYDNIIKKNSSGGLSVSDYETAEIDNNTFISNAE